MFECHWRVWLVERPVGKVVLFQVARTHCITAWVICERKNLIEKLDSKISVLVKPTSWWFMYNSYAHVGMYPLFALMLPAWRFMHYILNCRSYLKYHLRVAQIIAYSVVIYGRLDSRVETICPGGVSISWLANRSRHFFVLWNLVLF